MRGTIARTIGACRVVLALAACSGDGEGAGTEATEPAETGTAATPHELREGELEPGSYAADSFAAPFRFEVGEDWRVYEYEPDLVTLGRERSGVPEGTIPFRVVGEVYDPATSELVPAPRRLARWLGRHPHLEVRSIQPVEFGGLLGARVRMQAAPSAPTEAGCEGPCVRIAPPTGGADERGLVVERSAMELLALPLGDGRTLTVHVAAISSSFRGDAAEFLPTVMFDLTS